VLSYGFLESIAMRIVCQEFHSRNLRVRAFEAPSDFNPGITGPGRSVRCHGVGFD
jgi:hypothetical protein